MEDSLVGYSFSNLVIKRIVYFILRTGKFQSDLKCRYEWCV